MKDFTKEELERSYPNIDELEAITFCLEQLYSDKEKLITDSVAEHLTYEELIGTLILVKKRLDGDKEEDEL